MACLEAYYRRRFGFRPGQFPGSEADYEGALSLPLYPALTDADAVRVAEVVRRTLVEHRP